MKNRKIILAGIVAGSLFSLVICELLHGMVALIAGADKLEYYISGIKVQAGFTLEGMGVINSLIYLFPWFLSVAVIETGIQLLKKLPPGNLRNFLIICPLIIAGFLLYDVFYGAFSVILKHSGRNDWVQGVLSLNLSDTGGMAFIFMAVIITAAYLNLSLKRIIKYINL